MSLTFGIRLWLFIFLVLSWFKFRFLLLRFGIKWLFVVVAYGSVLFLLVLTEIWVLGFDLCFVFSEFFSVLFFVWIFVCIYVCICLDCSLVFWFWGKVFLGFRVSCWSGPMSWIRTSSICMFVIYYFWCLAFCFVFGLLCSWVRIYITSSPDLGSVFLINEHKYDTRPGL